MKKVVLICSLLGSLAAQAQNAPLPEPVKQIEKQGIEIIKPFTAPGGVEGWLGKYQDTGVTIYLTPDKKHAISGYMYDAQGNNLSEKIINDEIYIPAGREMWKTLTQAQGIKEGSEEANCKVVMFADPFCPYCNKFWHEVQPLIKDKRVSMTTLLVGVIRPESGQYAAAILAADDPRQAWYDLENSNGKSKPALKENTPRPIFDQIQSNQQFMNNLGANGTPAIYYLNKDRALQQILGMPNAQQMADLAACK
ncbi:MAG TPA: thiol:disulfide interchange protein DsbG [Escherichia sp.]|uniref:thiol:disulfide interchange protein DsbG n=1 Tax=Pseudescherichia vulneris TaxID=566 RepID=UPI000E882A7E|nr:thiol:disulfide interchange protein DsbG [Pseudescherichia vulneris]HBC82822.1 thiol:disulfide interchange protein DsbG [Escherichia sp.]